MRICSLLPSSTEIVYALGLENELVAVTHECDYPPAALEKPRITSAVISPACSSAEIDVRVRQELELAGTLYQLDESLLASLRPDVIFTQQLCTVCAVSYDNVHRVAGRLKHRPEVVNLEPTSVDDIYETIYNVGAMSGVADRAVAVVRDLRVRQESVRRKCSNADRARLLFLEWLNPPFCAGHWIPELIADAGGSDPFARKNLPSTQLAWDAIIEYNPDILVVSCCGFNVDRTLLELEGMKNSPLYRLKAVENGKIVIVDGSSYFSRPGPRIIDSLEILAHILHPELVEATYPESVVREFRWRMPEANA